uniref:Uncharacterized protein n=2 Tax=viral metagenome TaxID=1070528 RepID=A0A6H1ZWK3_9ZZZZ
MKWFKTKKREPFRAELVTGATDSDGRLDVYSETWVFVRNHCEKRLSELREKNDHVMAGDKTAIIRGQIRFIKEVLGLPNPKRKFNQEEKD